ncbi:MAG: hypothetical protein JO264_21970 [Acidisphaera sp.]|nr:hypothetical protein [Acidisphaera sp.]
MSGIYGSFSVTLPVAWLAALATSELRLAVYGMRGLYGVTRFLHLVGVAGFVGTVMLIDLRGLGLFPAASMEPVRAPLGMLLNAGFVVAVVSGLALFLYDPLGVGLHTMFLPKLVLIGFGLVHARGLRPLAGLRRTRLRRRGSAAISLLVWLSVMGCSTWNHVERPVRVNAALAAELVGRE